MARTINRLSAKTVEKAKKPGLYCDGAGLYLHIGNSGGKSWIFRYMLHGRSRDLGLGPLYTISLADARALALDARKLRLAGIDPVTAKHAARQAQRMEAARAITFKACAERYIVANRAGWKNAKHAEQWSATLARYVLPIVGALPVSSIDTGHVTKILEPIWATKTETAGRVRGRIEAILDYAAAHHWRDGPNPSRWRGHLENVLPKRSKVSRVKHHPALPYADTGAFIAQLRKQDGIAARALEFAILTAARSGEVFGARWREFNLVEKIWVIPAVRMKAGREHRTPLSTPALAILEGMLEFAGNGQPDAFVFPGASEGNPLSNMAMTATLRRMRRGDLTVHGFRSTFRDWVSEQTTCPSEVAELALGHSVGNAVARAYQRSDLFEKRRALAKDWATFCTAEIAA